MSTSKHIPITSTELATLWTTYQEKTMIMRFLEYFLENDENDQQIFQLHYNRAVESVELIKNIFQHEGAAIPIGFTENDVNKGAPKLYDYMFDVMYLRLMAQIETGLFSLYSNMSYRKDIRHFFKRLTAEAQEAYDQSTHLLLETGVISRPPYVSSCI
ncbi:DUF3231 family protein [Bacillus songklensis]|uniref:DUF3231 family protein n=1 Tax=Bacillus songklensis TaxID=1069116 RepID=A0ABV8B9A6_9BACI